MFGIPGGAVDRLIRRLPTTRNEQDAVSWFIDLFDLLDGGENLALLALRSDITAHMAGLHGMNIGVELPPTPPEGHTLHGRWLLQFAINTLGRTHRGQALAQDCQTFLNHAKPWMLSI